MQTVERKKQATPLNVTKRCYKPSYFAWLPYSFHPKPPQSVQPHAIISEAKIMQEKHYDDALSVYLYTF